MLPLSSGLFDVINAPKSLLPLKGYKSLNSNLGIPLIINSEPGIAYCVAQGVLTQSPAQPRNQDLDINFDCDAVDNEGNYQHGISLEIAYGNIPFIDFISSAISQAQAYGSPNIGKIYTAIAIAIINAYGDLLLDASKSNWVKWSNIGSLDFTINKGNVAGERPLDWKGMVYAIKKLSNKVIVYGENGISMLIPSETSYGLNTIYRIGLKGKNAIAGDDSSHFFIDKIGQLWRLGESLEKLDYSEYLSEMNSNLVMSYDNLNQLVYICDGSNGYVYNPLVGSFGKAQSNITGISAQNGNFYIAAPSAIITPTFEFCTDVYDFGTRNNKIIFSLEIGIDIVSALYAAIDYKRKITDSFVSTPWLNVPAKGKVFIHAFGKEFRIKLKTTNYEWFILNYINVNGNILDN